MPSPVRTALGTVLTLVIMILAILPPILHFFTGPIAPAIGGFIAGRTFHLSDREAAVMGVVLAVLAGIPAYLALGSIIDSNGFAIGAAIVASLWSGGLAMVAAWFAGGAEDQTASVAE